jgi:uncharacterized protein (TIRG00374 family)
MRSHLRTAIVLFVAAALLALFLYNVDLRGVVSQILHADVAWLLFALATMFVNLAVRAWRWQYLLEPLGRMPFGSAFRATAVGFAASSVLPARAGEVIRPYFLAREERISATGAFATIILERVLDTITVLVLLGIYLFLAGDTVQAKNSVAFEAVKWTGGVAAAGAVAALIVLFVVAGNPARLAALLGRLEQVLPSKLAGLLADIAHKFAVGLGAVRSPRRLLYALVLSLPLWISIALGEWAAALAFRIAMPFTGSFLMLALLVIGVAVPTPGAVGSFHAMFRFGATTFFGAPDDAAVGAAIVLHALTVAPSLLLGLFYAAQAGLNVSAMRHLADQAEADSRPT